MWFGYWHDLHSSLGVFNFSSPAIRGRAGGFCFALSPRTLHEKVFRDKVFLALTPRCDLSPVVPEPSKQKVSGSLSGDD